LAVQGQDKGSIFCDKCFTNAPKGSEYCPNCGAPFVGLRGMHVGDPAIYPRLAHANLLRMRKQYKNAEDECLSILRQYPNNLSANVLLGDIAAERGDMVQAAEWYELALDIDAGAPNVQEKLAEVREKHEQEEVATTAQQLGLPVEKPKTALITGIALLTIVVVGLLAFIAYQTAQRGSAAPQGQVDRPVVVGDSENKPSPVPPIPRATTGGQPNPGPSEDAELQHVLGTTLNDKAALVSAWYDPAENGVTITYAVPTDKDERELGAKMATESFAIVSDNLHRDIEQVQLKAVRDHKTFYTAMVKKSDYQETQTKDWQEKNKEDAKAFLDKVLSKEKHFDEGEPAPTPQPEGKTSAGASPISGPSTAPTTSITTSTGSTEAKPSTTAGTSAP